MGDGWSTFGGFIILVFLMTLYFNYCTDNTHPDYLGEVSGSELVQDESAARRDSTGGTGHVS